jgi:hypothetical protein
MLLTNGLPTQVLTSLSTEYTHHQSRRRRSLTHCLRPLSFASILAVLVLPPAAVEPSSFAECSVLRSVRPADWSSEPDPSIPTPSS